MSEKAAYVQRTTLKGFQKTWRTIAQHYKKKVILKKLKGNEG